MPAPTASPSRLAGRHASGRPTIRRRLPAVGGLVVVVGACVVASLAVGARWVPPVEVWSALTGPAQTEGEVVVRELRLPRTVLGLAVGLALGAAGALIQGHTRNPIADPGLLGVSAGAALAVVIGISQFGVLGTLGQVWFALAGALAASAVVFGLGAASARRRSAATPLTLALVGAAMTALLSAVTASLLLTDLSTLDTYRFWVVGSVAGRGWAVLTAVLPFLAIGALLAAGQGRTLNALGLGDDVARGLGMSVWRARAVGILAIALLTGAAVAAAGPIAFVGLVAPHTARALSGPDFRWLVPLSALVGAGLLLAADVVGRIMAAPGEVQVGITLAFVGAPFFIALVRRRTLVTL